MKIKNLSAKPIYIGNAAILPDETKEIADAWKNHPVVKMYIDKKLIEIADGKSSPDPKKEISKMNLESLRAKAKELEIEFADTDTKAVLVDKITAKLQAEQG